MGPSRVRRIGPPRWPSIRPLRSESAGVGMSTPTLGSARSRWLDWKPKARILENSAENEPTKPSKPGSVGFVGATLTNPPKIEAEQDPAADRGGGDRGAGDRGGGHLGGAESGRPSVLLDLTGCRLIRLDDVFTIGIWRDLDAPELRGAIAVAGLVNLPVRFLDEDDLPERYRVRSLRAPLRPPDVTFQQWLQLHEALPNGLAALATEVEKVVPTGVEKVVATDVEKVVAADVEKVVPTEVETRRCE